MDGFFHRLFAGSVPASGRAAYSIFGVPFDSTTSFRSGTRSGPSAIRDLSYNYESYIPWHDLDLATVPITDLGDLDVNVVADDMVIEVQAAVQEMAAAGRVPVMLGGEHSITVGAVRAVRPDCFVVCDAHLDLREEFRGSVYNHACTTRRVYEDGVTDIIIIGGRSGTADQFAFARENLVLYTADDVMNLGIRTVIGEVLDNVGKKRVYFSIDADAIDSCLTPGLGTPEPFGLSPLQVREVVAAVAPRSVAFDYVEVCPSYDNGQAAAVGAAMVREFIAAHWKAKKPD